VFFYASLQNGSSNTTLDALAMKSGEEIKKTLVDGARKMGGSHSYINYTNGRESLREIYGEEWRLEKLRQLKRRHDPRNQFRLYALILLGKE
jgi:hypothetical protein